MTHGEQLLLFELAPRVSDIDTRRAQCEALRDTSAADAQTHDAQARKWSALAHALRAFARDARARHVAFSLAEGGWAGTGRELVATTRALLAETTTDRHSRAAALAGRAS